MKPVSLYVIGGLATDFSLNKKPALSVLGYRHRLLL
jgi:hypothetical protein